MHKLTLSTEFRQSLRQRRNGREHVFDLIEPKKTALLVIDTQNAHCSHIEMPHGRLAPVVTAGIYSHCANTLKA